MTNRPQHASLSSIQTATQKLMLLTPLAARSPKGGVSEDFVQKWGHPEGLVGILVLAHNLEPT